jgi:asparagine synthase (glutamine-hydrolysing)
MCGITGIVKRTPLDDADLGLVERLNALLAHRGPDGAGQFTDEHVALAMRRLAIIDLNAGWQPLYNEDRSLALVANGEVYNFVELRKTLEARGHRYATGSDCENILHLYEEHGNDCVHHLRGMYAFALWDSRRRQVLIVRDRFGEKPLYLAETPDRIVFASELKVLIASGIVELELEPNAIDLYFHHGYVPEPYTPIRGVRKLPAGCMLSIDVDDWTVTQSCYWRMQDAPPIEREPVETIREELDKVSELIIRSDVPVGVALSGGMDSSAIAALAASKYPGTMHAISLGYAGRPLQDERGDARALADKLGMPFHDVELSTQDVVESIPEMVYYRDDPIADISGPSYFAIMKRAREENLPVMLAGQGGDELFWGYPWVRQAVHFSERKDRFLNGESVGLGEYLTVSRPPISYTGSVRWLRALGGLRTGWRQRWRDQHSPAERLIFYDIEPYFQQAEALVRSCYTGDFREQLREGVQFEMFTLPRPWKHVDVEITRLICQSYLLENGIAQGDRLSMASSVELRLPLVDYKLVETVVGLRKVHRDVEDVPKKWLREAVRPILPDFVMNRRKRGFTPPWREWAAAVDAAYGHHLVDGALVEAGVLTPEGAKVLAGRLRPHPLGAACKPAEYALTLEMWLRAMQSHRGRTLATASTRTGEPLATLKL